MSWTVIVLPRAKEDMAEIRDDYETSQIGLGTRFINAMDSLLKHIEWNPKTVASGYRGVRATKHPRFPHVMRYQIKRSNVEVFAVTHGSRRASAWTSRLP